jgi:uncharacterized protein
MNNTGLRQPDLDIVLSVLSEFPNIKEAVIFGSRAKGNFRNGSDVDIALKGENINLEIVTNISYRLNEETILPYKFDVLDYQNINNSKLTEHINRKGISFYIR